MNASFTLTLRTSTLSIGVLLTVALVGCGGNENIVRPDGFNATNALGQGIACTDETVKKPVSPFIVEWSDGDRAALESEMGNGLALVKFSCQGVQVLSGCAIPGTEYKYKGLGSKKTKALQMNDATAAQASLQSYTLPGSLSATFEQGKALSLAYVMVGNQSSTVNTFYKAQILAPHCKEATHFVSRATLGAYVLAAGERGKAAAAGELLGYGNASGETSSARSVQSSDGDPQACTNAGKDDSDPTEGCSAIAQIGLIPLIEGEASGAAPIQADTRRCDAGYVLVDGGCVAEDELAEDDTFLCKEGDWNECRTQCDKGSDESCGRLAGMLIVKYFPGSEWYRPYGLEETSFNTKEDFSAPGTNEAAFLKEAGPQLNRMKVACDNVEPDACVVAAAIVSVKNDNDDYPQKGATLKEWLGLIEQGCRDGQDIACPLVETVYASDLGSWADDADKYGSNAVAKNIRKFEEIVSEGCDSGSAAACNQLGTYYIGAWSLDAGFKADYKKAAKFWAEACLGGIGDACIYATAAYTTRDANECKSFFQTVLVKDELDLCFGVPCEPDDDKGIGAFCSQSTGFENKAQAYYTSAKACYFKDNAEYANLCKASEKLKDYAAE